MIDFIKRRVVPLVLCLALLVGAFSYRPQKADAIAITSTAAVVAAVAAIMTACGVTYWAASEQDAIDYLGGKIEDYLTAVGSTASDAMEWLGIDSLSDLFMVIQGGALSFPRIITNKILDFIRWFNTEEGVVSGGNAIGGNPSIVLLGNTPTVLYSDANIVIECMTETTGVYAGLVHSGGSVLSYYWLSMNWGPTVSYRTYAPGNESGSTWATKRLTRQQLSNGEWVYYDNMASSVSTPSSAYVVYSSEEALFDSFTLGNYYTSSVTPLETVTVPQDLSEGQTLVVTTTAPIQSDDDVEAASEAILGEIASEDGLDATNATEGEAVPSAWTWLYNVIHGLGQTVSNIYETLLDIPQEIANAIHGLFVPAEDFFADYVDALYATFADRVGVLTYPLAVTEAFLLRFLSAGVGDPVISWSAVVEPFSHVEIIHAGSYNFNTLIQNQSMARVHEVLQVVLKAGLAFELFVLCRKKYNAIIHGRAS